MNEAIVTVLPDGNVIVGAGVTFDQAIQALEHARAALSAASCCDRRDARRYKQRRNDYA